jgi:hypothetical protein
MASRSALGAPLAETLPWRWLCVALFALWAATVLGWWATSRRRSRGGAEPRSRSGAGGAGALPATRAAWRQFREACERNDPVAAMRALRAWAAARWPESPPLGLRAIAARLEDRELVPRLLDLERACYAGGAWQGAALPEALRTARDRKTAGSARPPVLEPLYPDTDADGAPRGAPIR